MHSRRPWESRVTARSTAILRPRLAPIACLAIGAGLVLAASSPAIGAGASLSIWHDGAWRPWWRADVAPDRWTGPDDRVTGTFKWQPVADGVAWATARLACSAPAWRTRLIVVRIDPRRVRLTLEMALSGEDGRPAWTIDRAPRGALMAVNAGQFIRTMPWGWLVMGGRQRLSPGVGPLSAALAVDTTGATRWVSGDSLATPPRDVVTAFQSYPTLLAHDGEIPRALRAGGTGVDLAHRDARLAIGETRDGQLIVAMTRFDALGESTGPVPIGPTTPEMAAVMGALGARDAVMLDGGISAQLMLRDPKRGKRWRWPGWRKVPLALLVWPREP